MITLRHATIHDLETLSFWDSMQHVIDSDPNDDWNWQFELCRQPEWREQLLAELNGREIGIIQIIDPFHEESQYWGEVEPNKRAIDIWIGFEEDLGKGYGTEMMHLAIGRCFHDPKVTSILIDPLVSNKRAIKFYRRLGFKFLERRNFGTSECQVYELKRSHWEKGMNAIN